MEWINYLKYLLSYGFRNSGPAWVRGSLWAIVIFFYVFLGNLLLTLILHYPSLLLVFVSIVIYKGYLDWKKENTDE